ncbi:MAG TPA: hypothetical protein VJ488_03295 [Dehalococcoidia bacterium]|nr:hypothetical protein [Dehalococcoidia bacterium]
MPDTNVLFDEELKEYDFGAGHPFRGDRYVNFYNYFQQIFREGIDYTLLKATPATDRDLQFICHKNYIEFTRGYYEAANWGIHYPGKFNDFHSMDNLPTGRPGHIEEAARLVIGQAKLAAQLVMNNQVKTIISIGGGLHHAKPNFGEGFCLYNDVAFCARYLLQEYGLNKIVILDTDAHCGNGTMEYFYEDDRVLFIDLHQDPLGLYPGTGFVQQIGAHKGKGFTINIPLPEYASNAAYELAFKSIVEPVIREFSPQIMIRNGGADPHYADGLTKLGMNMEGFRMMGQHVQKMSQVCDGKLIDMIGSGYNREVLPYAWTTYIAALTGLKYTSHEPVPPPFNYTPAYVLPETKSVILEAINYLKPYWECLNTEGELYI